MIRTEIKIKRKSYDKRTTNENYNNLVGIFSYVFVKLYMLLRILSVDKMQINLVVEHSVVKKNIRSFNQVPGDVIFFY